MLAMPRGMGRRRSSVAEAMNKRPAWTAAVARPERARVAVRCLEKKGMTLKR